MRSPLLKRAFPAVFALFCLLLPTPSLFAQSFTSLSSRGEALFNELRMAYPAFNEAKLAAEAAERFRVCGKGEAASVSCDGLEVSGVFQGLEGGFLLIGSQRLPLSGLQASTLERFDATKAAEAQALFLRNARELWRIERMRALEKSRAGLMLKYPGLDERKLAFAFSGVDDAVLRLSLMNECAGLYEASLPLSSPRPELLPSCVETLVKARPELELDGGRVHLRQALAESRARAKEAAARKALREAAFLLRPRVAAPEFEPDGGPFSPAAPLEIRCPTPGASIRYTLDGSEPDESSPLYSVPLKLKQAVQVKAFALRPEMNDSSTAVSAPWTGLGLYASYFDRLNFSGSTSSRIDPELDFDWTGGSPDPALPADFFSAIWAGSLCAPESGDYSLYVLADDGVRLWIDGRLLADSWSESALLDRPAKLRLEAGRPVNIKIAYCEFSSMPRIRLDWSSERMRRRPVPFSALSAKGGYADELLRWNERQGGAYVNRASMPNPGAVDGQPLFKELTGRTGKTQSQDSKP